MTNEMMVLLILLVLAISAWPVWPYSSAWGYRPSSIFIVVLLILLILILAENRPFFKSTRQDINPTAQNVGDDLKTAGRNTADAIRKVLQ